MHAIAAATAAAFGCASEVALERQYPAAINDLVQTVIAVDAMCPSGAGSRWTEPSC